MKKIIEITGVAGVGKSFTIEQLLKQNPNTLLDTQIIKKYNLNDISLLFLFFKSNRSFKNLLNILKLSTLVKNMGLFNRLNLIRNSIKKIGKDYFLRYKFKEDKIILVDEGISHLYQNIISPRGKNSKKAIRVVDKIISNINFSSDIIVVDAPFEIIYKRLKSRGHKRVPKDKLAPFIKNSKEQIVRLKRRFPKVVEILNIENKSKIGERDV